jgi:hypothetical protein
MRRIRFGVILAACAVSLLLALVSCGGGADGEMSGTASSPRPQGEETTVAVELAPWFVSADPASVPAGTVRFDVTVKTSPGQSGHALTVLRTDLRPDELPTGSIGEARTSEEGIEVVYWEPIQGKDTYTAEVALERGSYVLICNIANHYARGMRTGFEVT